MILHIKSSVISILAATTTLAYAQFALEIVKPIDQEYLQLGGTFPVELRAFNTGATATAQTQAHGTGQSIRLSLCTEITGLPLCNHTDGTILLTASFQPPSQTYQVTIPMDQTPGLTKLLAGHVTCVDGTERWTSKTSIEVYLGNRI